MASSIVQKVLRNQSVPRVINAFAKTQPDFLLSSLLCEQSPTLSSVDQQPTTECSISNHSPIASRFCPAFSFGHFLNPSPVIGIFEPSSDDVVSGDSGMIWADSVKKKRKKKMNKHKLRKLRKRLRRKT